MVVDAAWLIAQQSLQLTFVDRLYTALFLLTHLSLKFELRFLNTITIWIDFWFRLWIDHDCLILAFLLLLKELVDLLHYVNFVVNCYLLFKFWLVKCLLILLISQILRSKKQPHGLPLMLWEPLKWLRFSTKNLLLPSRFRRNYLDWIWLVLIYSSLILVMFRTCVH